MQMQSFGLLEIVLVVFMFAFYFLPSLVAYLRKHKNLLAIFLLNLFLGWSVLGWVISLVWSATK